MPNARNKNTLEQSVTRAQNKQETHQNDVKELALVFLLTVLSKFHSLPCRTHCRWKKY